MEVRLQNLTKVFNKDTVAVNQFTVTIPSGKLIGLLGPSGCGKSTTLYMISGLLDPTKGSIFFGSEDVTRLAAEKRGIGLVFQNYALYPHMTVLQNIMFPLENLKTPKEEAKKKAYEIAKLVQIDNLMNRKPAQLSGGQQQRVAIARALVKNPQVLLLDEPLSNLDARLRLQTREEIKRIQQETGITTIFVTHDQEEAMSISDEIIVLNEGLLQQKGVPQEVYNNPANLFVAKFLGNPTIGIFDAKVNDGQVFLNNKPIFADDRLKGLTGDYLLGIRPEGYVPNVKGAFAVNFKFIETIGKDISIVAQHPSSTTPTFRILVNDDSPVDKNNLIFDIKKEKSFIFEKVSGRRVF